ncbi:MAG: hypothetical protein R3B47_01240 [Bacteroidia bacterium]
MNYPTMINKKNLIALFALLLMMTCFVQAQEGVKIGFRVSPMIPRAVVNDSSKQPIKGLTTKPAASFGAGIIMNMGFSQQVSLTTGISFQQLRYASTYQVPGGSTAGAGDTTWLEAGDAPRVTSVVIPLGLKLRSPEIGTGIHLWANIGAQANIPVAYSSASRIPVATTDRVGNTSYTVREVDVKGTENVEPVTVSFVPAFGLDAGHLQAGMSYHWGLMNILSSSNPSRQNTKLSYVALNLGYFF